MKKPSQLSTTMAEIVVILLFVIVFGTLFGAWVKWFWLGWVFA